MPEFRLPDAGGYLVALSGGADSRLLLELTVRAALSRRMTEVAALSEASQATKKAQAAPGAAPRIMAVHLHHGIRGAEADRDEAFCRAVCTSLGVPLVVEHADIPALSAASGRSLEAEARDARYALFGRVMTEEHLPVLLTAHHADDQLETVLHHLLRGSGTRGMGGIPPVRTLDIGADAEGRPRDSLPSAAGSDATFPHAVIPDAPLPDANRAGFDTRAAHSALMAENSCTPTVFRPLLHWTRRDILTACDELGLDYVTDSTNLVPDCTRNRLRLHIIPALEAMIGEGVPQRAAGRLAAAAREDDEALTAIARARYEAAMRHPPLPAGETPPSVPPADTDATAAADASVPVAATAAEKGLTAQANADSTPDMTVCGTQAVPPAAARVPVTADETAVPRMDQTPASNGSACVPKASEERTAGLPIAAAQAEPAAIAKRMIGLAYTDFYYQTAYFHHNSHHANSTRNHRFTTRDFAVTTPNPTVPPDRTLSAHHLEALLALCRAGREGTVSDRLPGDVCASIRDGRLVFEAPAIGAQRHTHRAVEADAVMADGVCRTGSPPPDPSSDPPARPAEAVCTAGPLPRRSVRIIGEGTTVWDAVEPREDGGDHPVITVEVTRTAAPCEPVTGADVWASAVFPATVLDTPLLLRPREAGDVIFSHGMNKKIKKMFCDKHIPLDMRERLPLLCRSDGVPLWVPGVAFRDGYPAPKAGAAVMVTVRLGRGDVAPCGAVMLRLAAQ